MSKHISEFTERIKELMEVMHIRQTDISQRTGISESTVSKYISGQQMPRSDKIGLIASTYGVNPAWLLGYDVPMMARDMNKVYSYVTESTPDLFVREASTPYLSDAQHSDQQLQRLLAYASAILRLKDSDRRIVEDMIDRLSGGKPNVK